MTCRIPNKFFKIKSGRGVGETRLRRRAVGCRPTHLSHWAAKEGVAGQTLLAPDILWVFTKHMVT
jgi:hypothetical protein